jgi:HEAT repeat protein
MQNRGSFRFIQIVGLLLCAFHATRTAAADATAPLHYAFQAGQTYVYDLTIQINLPDTQQTLAGLSKYQVKSVDASTGQITLTHSADLASTWRSTGQTAGAGMRAMRMSMGSPFAFANFNSPCQIVIDPNGTIVRYERKSQLPYLLGNVWALAIEPLPSAGQNTWQAKREVEIAEQDTHAWFPRPMANNPTNWSATETIDYSIADPAAETPAIARTYAMTTAEQTDDEPVFSQKGQGKLTFDSKAGAIQSIDEKYTLRINDPGVTLKVPITITAKLLSAAEADKKTADRKAAADKIRLAAEDAQKLKPINNDELDQLLASIKSSNPGQPRQAVDKLAHSIPIESRRDEVASVLVDILSKHDHFTVMAVEKALKVWGNDNSTAALIKLLEDHDFFIRTGAMDALATQKTDQVAEAVAKHLTDSDARMQASQALQEMGEVAEKPVLPLLTNLEWTVRISACEILAAVGTSQSIDALKAATSDDNGIVQMKAKDALKAIEARAEK